VRPDVVQVTLKEYERLKERDEELAALEAFGVDNWEGYGEAMRSLAEDIRSETENE
jgi:hypothetical protein